MKGNHGRCKMKHYWFCFVSWCETLVRYHQPKVQLPALVNTSQNRSLKGYQSRIAESNTHYVIFSSLYCFRRVCLYVCDIQYVNAAMQTFTFMGFQLTLHRHTFIRSRLNHVSFFKPDAVSITHIDDSLINIIMPEGKLI